MRFLSHDFTLTTCFLLTVYKKWTEQLGHKRLLHM